eukprot:764155-Hanusia_phi.AAC.2
MQVRSQRWGFGISWILRAGEFLMRRKNVSRYSDSKDDLSCVLEYLANDPSTTSVLLDANDGEM